MAQPPTLEQTIPQRLAIEDIVLVKAPIEQVYQQWSDVSHFSDLMRNVKSVTPIGDQRYHWITSFFGQRQEWDTDVTLDADRRTITWRSVTGDEHNGDLTFTPQNDGATTEIRLRMEITPPQGLAPQRVDRLAQSARRRTHSDLRRFSRQMAAPQQRDEAPTGVIGMATQLGVAATAAGLGGYAAYMVGQRLRGSASYRAMRSQVIPPASMVSWSLAGASAASALGSATFRQIGHINNALFVGQWAPTLLAASGFARIVGHRGIHTPDGASIASWSLVGASVGSIAASATLHAMGRRKQGLFVGQWAPTLMGAAVFTRLFNRL